MSSMYGRGHKAFDFSVQMEKLVRDVAQRSESLSHIDPKRILFCVAQARNGGRIGLQAKVLPLRFEGGRRTVRFGRWLYRMPALRRGPWEVLYLLYFYLPRFQDGSFTTKLHTVFHELYHISPQFDGDLRRFPGRKFLHGPSERAYDRIAAEIMRTYLARPGRNGAADFLNYSFGELERRYGPVVG